MYQDSLDLLVECLYTEGVRYQNINAGIIPIIHMLKQSLGYSEKHPEFKLAVDIYNNFLNRLIELDVLESYDENGMIPKITTYRKADILFDKVSTALTEVHQIYSKYAKETLDKNDSWLYIKEKGALRDILTSFKNFKVISEFNIYDIKFSENS